MRLRAPLAVLGGAAASPAAAPAAGPATVSVGSPLTANFTPLPMGAGGQATFAQTALPGSTVTAPSDGTVISWQARRQGGPFTRRIVPPLGGVNYIGTGFSAPYAPGNFAASLVLPTSLPIQAGDLIGIQTTSGNGLDSVGASTPVLGARAIA